MDKDGVDMLAATYDGDQNAPPTDRAVERHSRMDFDGNKYPNCRQRDKGVDRCKKHPDGTCPTCRTCPVCGGMLAHESRSERLAADIVKPVTVARCVNCGALMERDIHRPRRVARPRWGEDRGLPAMCAVRGCRHRTWTGHKVSVEGRDYAVCDYHKRQHQRWVRGGQDEKLPHLIIKDGTLQRTWRKE